MAVSKRVLESMNSSSWVRAMFETGIRLKNEHGADKVFDFSLGNPDLEPPAFFHDTIKSILDEGITGRHGYMPNGGYPEVRDAVAAYVTEEYGESVDRNNVIMACGAGGALNVVLKSILDPGDTVLSCTPCFMEYRAYVDNHGGELVLVNGKDDFDLDIEGLESAMDKRTAAVIINSPNNPSGRIYPKTTIAALGKMLDRKSKELGRSIYLISDEPYRKIVYGGAEVPSVFKFYTNSIIVSSYSKELSVPGERIGWIAVHPKADDAETLMNALILCTRILGFVNAPGLMQHAIGRLAGHQVDISPYVKRREMLCRNLRSFGYKFTEPQGTFYLFVEAPGGEDMAFVKALQEELVLTVPGRGFGAPGYFRVAFCQGEDVIERSLPSFEKVIKKFDIG
ncbi:MAG: pyridoxal phosphate-dependent aminotransferase [Spirochaetales bacterium]|jgi:aspartate aminotransferase|nr:pyridoxal phosphate-dependent aminotransferase [Spirochaetales bacterium]